MRSRSRETFARAVCLLALLSMGVAMTAVAQDGGALGNATSARATALGGATVASVTTPLEAMQGNPAGLTELNGRSLDLSAASLFTTGNFTSSVSNRGTIATYAGTLPYGSFAMRLGSSRFTLGISAAPDTMMTANWKYIDPPGGLGKTSYGLQENKSAILGLRFAAGLGFVVNHKLSVGGTVGMTYNQNTLDAPYIFQEQPTLAGAKTLLGLHTSGRGWNGSFGALITANRKLKFGLAYKTSTTVHSHGSASGNVDAQFATLGLNARPDFHYDAEVDNKFPQAFSGGVSWQVHPRARLNLQSQWINWSDAFKLLPVKLTNGNNAAINGLVGSNTLNDFIPLQWRNQAVFGVGVESPLGEYFMFRAGYSYATNPVPSATLTPLTAAILQNTIGTGVGYSRGRYNLDLAYQVQLPTSASVGQSTLRSGEYNNSRVEVAVQSITLTTRIHF